MSTLKADTIVASDGSSPVTLTKQQAAKALADIDMSVATAVLDNSFNVSSITDNGTGDGTLSFTSSFNGQGYFCSGMTSIVSSFTDPGLIHQRFAASRQTGTWRFGTTDVHNAADIVDYDPVMIIIHGDLA